MSTILRLIEAIAGVSTLVTGALLSWVAICDEAASRKLSRRLEKVPASFSHDGAWQ